MTRIAGYAALFGAPDLTGDVVRPGAFAPSLLRRGARGVRMLFQHDAGEPVGVWTSIREDGRGLYVEGEILEAGARGRTTATLVKAGAIDGLSIGYRPVRAQRRARGRDLQEVDLWEVSIVTFPMQPQARLRAVMAATADAA